MIRAAAGWGARFLRDHLFGFGVLDAIFFVTLYTFGSYFLIDTPLNFLLLAFYFHLVTSESPARQRIALFLMVALTVLLALSGVAIWLLPRVTPASVYVRLVHQTGARYYILILTPYLIRHFRTSLVGYTENYRWLTRLGWLALKISFWTAAIPALLSIKGQLTAIHTPFLLIALPLLVAHVALPARKRRSRAASDGPGATTPVRVEPFSVLEIGSRGLYFRAALLACVPVAIALVFRMPANWLNYGFPQYMVQSSQASFLPSPATTATGASFRPEYLAESNGCGQDPCHPRMFAQWVGSPHRNATNERYRAELERIVRGAGLPAARLCAGCHDPVSLFSGSIGAGAPLSTPEGLREGISCVACHGLEAEGDRLGNGSSQFRFPASYYVGPMSLPTLVGGWREHRRELHAKSLGSGRTCVGCHRFLPLEGELTSRVGLEDWLGWEVHAQPRMRAECRGSGGCIACHMPRIGENEKPWEGGLPLHHFDLGRMKDGRYEIDRSGLDGLG